MDDSKLVYLFFLFFIYFSFGSNHKCPDEQRDALLVFKQNISSINRSHGFYYKSYSIYEHCRALHGSSWYDQVTMNWNTSINCCNWNGITCNNITGDVITLNLRCGMLQDLSGNHISGHIPAWAGEIGGNNLFYLDLSYNFIAGLTEFRSDGLTYLYLQSNLIQGPFPRWICSKKHLKYLDISNNIGITGMVPQCLLNISSSLVSLNVKSNMIQGPFPSWICDLGHLLYLDMSNNSFDGVIPQCFGNMISSLAMIDLSANQFSGTIPKVNGFCDLLDVFILNGNKLEGDVPCFLAKCQSLRILDLGNNQLDGIFPPWLGDLPKLQVLSLRSNHLHGSVGAFSISVFPFSSLRVFDISSNGFVGRLPERYFESFNAIKDVDKSQKTESVNISGLHSYSINVPVIGLQLSYSTSIYIRFTLIDLSSNRFEGEILNVIGNLKSLSFLNLSNNNLSGEIPNVIGNIFDMEALDLSRNQLIGEIPQSLTNLSLLEFLNLSQNHLTGRIPERGQLCTFEENSFLGNPRLCGLPLSRDCEDDLRSPEVEVEVEAEGGKWICLEAVMLGLGGGSLLGVVWGYRMLSTGRPKWLKAIADAGGHTRRRKQRKHVHTGKRS